MAAEVPPAGAGLARRLGLLDAVVIGLGAMIGSGIFAAVGPAAAAAGSLALPALLVAGGVAWCNATASAQLAAAYPEAGGTYAYGRARLSPLWGFLAGWAFCAGKLASCAAMALTFGAYAWPQAARPVAVAAVVALAAVNLGGVGKTAALTRVLVAAVLAALAAVVVAALGGGAVRVGHLAPAPGTSAWDVLQAAALWFFAFAGYARLATLGEEVAEPARTIPRAITLALGVTLAVYLVTATSAVLAAGPEVLAAAPAPLLAAVQAGDLDALAPAVRVGAAVGSAGVLLSLLAGVSRTVFAMARGGDLPRRLAAVHPRTAVPHVAELAVAAGVLAVVLAADVRGAIGFSAFSVLGYYAIANAAAFTQPPGQRRWPRGLQVAGLAGCVLLALTLPPASVLGGMAVSAAGLGIWWLRHNQSLRLKAR